MTNTFKIYEDNISLSFFSKRSSEKTTNIISIDPNKKVGLLYAPKTNSYIFSTSKITMGKIGVFEVILLLKKTKKTKKTEQNKLNNFTGREKRPSWKLSQDKKK